VAFIDNDQVEEIGRELLVDLFPFLLAGDCLIQGKVDLVVLLDLAIGDFVHDLAKRSEVLLHGLVDQDVAVGQKQDAFFGLGLPHAPDDLERGVGLAGASGHDQQHALLAFGNGFDGAVDGHALVVARFATAAVGVERLLDEFDRFGRRQPFPLLVQRPKIV
jgi:hypothetical protein